MELRKNKRVGKVLLIVEGARHSVVAVVNTKTSNISSVDEKEYLDAIFENLIEQYDFDINNAAIYYLFDRDPDSNTDIKFIFNMIDKLKNSRENDDNMRGGMLLLSYPAIEAYEISNFVDRSFGMQARLGSELKNYINTNAKIISMNKINEDSIIHAGLELTEFMDELGVKIDLDDFQIRTELFS